MEYTVPAWTPVKQNKLAEVGLNRVFISGEDPEHSRECIANFLN